MQNVHVNVQQCSYWKKINEYTSISPTCRIFNGNVQHAALDSNTPFF